jgi:ferredoxin-NADP reductase
MLAAPFPRREPATATAEVMGKRLAAHDVVVLDLAAPGRARLPDWTPGAHIDLVLPNGMTRQYSLCGDRWDAYSYRVAVLREPSGRDASAFVHRALAVGDRLAVGTPRNNFPLVPADEYVFIAGGIGITPLVPMVNQAVRQRIRWRLLYAGRGRASMVFLDESAGSGPDVRVAARDEGSRFDLAAELGAPRAGVAVYCCGPDRLLRAVEDLMAGWPPYTLRTERFTPAVPASHALDQSFEVELARTGKTLKVRPDESVLSRLKQAGADVLSSCGRGLCGTCEVTVLEGEPEHRDSLLDDDERRAGDCMYVCVSRSRTPRLVLDL